MATYTPNYNLYKPDGTDQFDNFLTEFGNNMDTIDQNLGGGGGSSTLAGLSDVNLTSPVTDDALIYDGAEWANTPLSAVAFSGDYTDLSNTPTIPTKTSDLNNDSDFVSDASYVHTDNNFTNADVTKLSGIQAGAEVNVQSDWNEADNTADDYIKNKPTIPTNTSDLNNDSGFLDSSDITVTQVQTTGTKIATIDVDGNSTDLYAPTGGGGSYTEGDGIDITSNTISVDTAFTEASTRANINSGDTFSTILGKIKKFFTDLKTVAFSGSYNDLSDKPTIPDISTKVSKSGDTMSGQLVIRSSGAEVGLGVDYNHSYTNSRRAGIDVGNNIPNGTSGSTYGAIALYGTGSNYTILTADNSTGNRNLYLPDKNGALATMDDVNAKVSKSGDTMTGALTINDSNAIQATFARNHSDTTSKLSLIEVGNAIPEGSAGASYGCIRINGTTSKYIDLIGRPSASRLVQLPDADGTLALKATVSLLWDNLYISTSDAWVGFSNANINLNDYDFIGFSWCQSDNPYNQRQVQSIISRADFMASTYTTPCIVVDDPFSAFSDARTVKVTKYDAHQISVYRGNAVWQYRRLCVFGIKM